MIIEEWVEVVLPGKEAEWRKQAVAWLQLAQKQGIVANKDQLLYRQNEPHQPQAIRDTLPILLGITSDDRFELEAKLRTARRDMKLNTKLLEEAHGCIDTTYNKGIGKGFHTFN